jgi:Spy/CpxP family protein refolding chaperone
VSSSQVWKAVPFGALGAVLLLAVGVSSDVAARGLQRPATTTSTTPQAPAAGQRPATPPGTDEQAWPKPWWQDDATKKELGLTLNQSKEIDRIYAADQAKLTQLSTEERQQETELTKLIRERQVDEKIISLKLDLVEASRTQFYKIRTLMLYRMYRVLTPDQNTKLQAIQDKMHGRRGGGAFH